MKKEEIWFLLVSKIPLDEHAQKEILETFSDAFETGRTSDFLTLLRASYMSERDILQRKSYYIRLTEMLGEMLKRRPDLASGPCGLYIGFIAEDLHEICNAELRTAGKALAQAQRLATNPQPVTISGKDLPSMPAPTMKFEEAQKDPERWVDSILSQDGLFEHNQLAILRDRLKPSEKKFIVPPRERAHALILLGAHLEDPPRTPWALGCYWAATTIDPSFDLPWAFLAHFASNPHEGLELANRALCANPKSLPGLINRGAIFGRLEKYEEAFRDLAVVAKFLPDNPRSLLSCAHAALDAKDVLRSAKLFFFARKAFPNIPEPWYGLARLFWKANLLETASRCQEEFRRLRHGNVPSDLRLPGLIVIEGPKKGVKIWIEDQLRGETPLEIKEALPGEHRIRWDGGPVRRIMIDEAESLRITWTGVSEDVVTAKFTPAPIYWPVKKTDGSMDMLSSNDLLSAFITEDLSSITLTETLDEILKGIDSPTCPFPPDTRLTTEWVFKILMEEILADGVFDREENEILRAIRDRLLIDRNLFDRILKDAQEKMVRTDLTKASPLDPRCLYKRLFKKAIEDGLLEPAERKLLEIVAEALLIAPEEIAKIETEIEQEKLKA